MSMRISLRIVVAVALASSLSCRKTADEVAAPGQPVENWAKLVSDFQEAYFKANPTFAVYQGRHEFDGQLPDWTADGIRKWTAELREWRDRASRVDMGAF